MTQFHPFVDRTGTENLFGKQINKKKLWFFFINLVSRECRDSVQLGKHHTKKTQMLVSGFTEFLIFSNALT